MGNSPSTSKNVAGEEPSGPRSQSSSLEQEFDVRKNRPFMQSTESDGHIVLLAVAQSPNSTGDLDSLLQSIQRSLQQLPRDGRNLIAGGIAGIVAKSVVAPLDRIKILYQVSSARFQLTDIPKVMANIIRDEGLSALWKGNMATMIRVFPYSGIQFMVFDACKTHLIQAKSLTPLVALPIPIVAHSSSQLPIRSPHADPIHTVTSAPEVANRHDRKWGLTAFEALGAGMIAGTVSVVCTYPLDLARVQLAVLKKTATQNHGFVSIMTENYARGGMAGLFRGISPTLIGILPYSGIAFALNEQGKQEIQHLTGRDVTTMERMQCGAFSGLVAQTVTYPIEVTRRRMQTIGVVGTNNDTALTSLGCSSSRPTFKSPPTMWATVHFLYTEQGWRGFLKGVTMNWMKGPVAFSISFTTFDYAKQMMEPPTP